MHWVFIVFGAVGIGLGILVLALVVDTNPPTAERRSIALKSARLLIRFPAFTLAERVTKYFALFNETNLLIDEIPIFREKS